MKGVHQQLCRSDERGGVFLLAKLAAKLDFCSVSRTQALGAKAIFEALNDCPCLNELLASSRRHLQRQKR